MVIIGITGSIGMGKTTIAKILSFCKIPIFDADEEVKKILDNNLSIINKIKSNWPECVYLQNNKEIIDKKKLGKIIFNNTKEKEKIEKIIHPIINKKRNIFLQEKKKEKFRLVGLDIPLLYETKTNKICNYILLASASELTQKNRVLNRDGMTIDKFNKINKNQLSDCFKRKQKPIIITTEFGKFITFILVIYYLILINFKLGINK
ncbi:dephospho-CoA kinase [Alphaproteobacteria bacterium]|nr:dephospho-CoA kinase [Alphaproteobacteria bacterium]